MKAGRGFPIGARLLAIVLAMTLFMLGATIVLSARSEAALLDETRAQLESLSKALQISVQQLTAGGESDDTLLEDYVQRLSRRGVHEISILSNDKQVVASSDKSKVGKRLGAPRRGPLIITGTLGGGPAQASDRTVQELDIPIVVDDVKRGYVRLNLVLDNYEAVIRRGFVLRLAALGAVFAFGFVGVAILARRMTRDIDRLAAAARGVGAGEIPAPVPTDRRDEIGRLVGAFNVMVERLRERRELEARLRRAERLSALGKLAGAMAHEVRNPLNLLSLTLDHVAEAYVPADPAAAAECRRLLGGAREELRRVDRLVREFLDYGRPPRLELRRCAVEEIVEEARGRVAADAERRGVDLRAEVEPGLPEIEADPLAIGACLVNLLQNALQATPPGGRVTVRAARLGEAARIEVRDTGAGIAAEDFERIFEPYFSKREGGVGLGLAIAQRIVEEHGGTVRASSAPGEGATFVIELPWEARR